MLTSVVEPSVKGLVPVENSSICCVQWGTVGCKRQKDLMPPFLLRECHQGLLSPSHEPVGLTSCAICPVRSQWPFYWLFSEAFVDELLVSLEPVSNLFSIRWHRWEGAATLHLLDITWPLWGPFPTKPCCRLAVLLEPVQQGSHHTLLGGGAQDKNCFPPSPRNCPAQSWLLAHIPLWVFRTHPFWALFVQLCSRSLVFALRILWLVQWAVS